MNFLQLEETIYNAHIVRLRNMLRHADVRLVENGMPDWAFQEARELAREQALRKWKSYVR